MPVYPTLVINSTINLGISNVLYKIECQSNRSGSFNIRMKDWVYFEYFVLTSNLIFRSPRTKKQLSITVQYIKGSNDTNRNKGLFQKNRFQSGVQMFFQLLKQYWHSQPHCILKCPQESTICQLDHFETVLCFSVSDPAVGLNQIRHFCSK